jgi:hypothetical protein
VPPAVLVSVVVAEVQTFDAPLIAGVGFTVTTAVLAQPLASEYVIVAVPEATPDTTPVDAPMAATAVLLLVQVPPPVVLVSIVVEPTQTVCVPAIFAGVAFTVTTDVLKQALASVNDMVAVPAAAPVTTPVLAFTVAIPVALLLQVPLLLLVSVAVVPAQIDAVPPITPGPAFTVRDFVA